MRRALPISAILLGLVFCGFPPCGVAQTTGPQTPDGGPAENLHNAETALQKKDFFLAESEYRFAAGRALIALGNLASAKGDWEAALTAYGEASQQLTDPTEPMLSVATVYLQQGKAAQAENVLRELNASNIGSPRVLQLLAVAYAAQKRFGEAVQQIGEARRAAPTDADLALGQATIALQAKDTALAERAFASLLQLRPGAHTHVLIGRTWRDYEHFEEAQRELEQALRLDPHVRRANYYLGTILIRRPDRLRDAIIAFQRELAIAPNDYLCNLNAGIALTSDRRAVEAVPYLKKATAISTDARPWYHLGQAQFQAGDAAGAAVSLARFITAAGTEPGATANLSSAEYVLAQALHSLGREAEAAEHFARAKDLKEKYRAESQNELQQYMAAEAAPSEQTTFWRISATTTPDSPALTAARAELVDVIARAYYNVGVILSQRQRYTAASASFYRASTWEPAFPQVQAALGAARFQAQQYALAIAPLQRAHAEAPANSELSRLLALSCFHTESYACTAGLLQSDPAVRSDASLQYALAVSLVKTGQSRQAAQVFSQLITRNRGSAELYVLLGDANAQQGDFDQALQNLQHALALDPKIAGAHLSTGIVMLRRGDFPLAEQHFRAELRDHPTDNRARYHLAYALSLQQKGAEALPLVREVLKQTPSFADARYLLGQLLLEAGDAAAAVEQLEVAIRLAPKEARAHYQLGRAYQKLGRAAEAQTEFDLFQQLKHGDEKP